jgi:hypothetical protein
MPSIEIVCDSADLTAVYGAAVPDVLVIGGFGLPDSMLPSLVRSVRDTKRRHLGNSYVPMKWNVKDLQRALELHSQSEILPVIKQKNNVLRTDLLQNLISARATLFISIILAYSNRKQVIGKTKDDLIRYSFGNLLMRVGLYSKRCNSGLDVQVILDWPEGGKRQPFISEYHTGWRDGASLTDQEKVHYSCGPLSALQFRPGLLFGVTDLDERLQLADLVVGAGRSFINFCLGKCIKNDFGVQQFVSIAPFLDRVDGWRCFGHGITVAPANSTFSEAILAGFKELKC